MYCLAAYGWRSIACMHMAAWIYRKSVVYNAVRGRSIHRLGHDISADRLLSSCKASSRSKHEDSSNLGQARAQIEDHCCCHMTRQRSRQQRESLELNHADATPWAGKQIPILVVAGEGAKIAKSPGPFNGELQRWDTGWSI